MKLLDRRPEYPDPGTRYGAWTYLQPGKGYRWTVRCDCGTVKEVRSQDLRQGASNSCGCLSAFGIAGGEANLTHGIDYGSKLYRTWRNAKNRCFNPKATKYKDYGAKGITMHPAWAASFETFAEAVGEPPSPEHSLDRQRNTEGYVPGNVKWSTPTEQANNTRRNVRISFEGRTQTVAQWARERGIGASTIASRLRAGWSPSDALTKKIKGQK